MQRLLMTLGLCLMASTVQAGNWNCGDTTKLFLYSVGFDVTTVPACPGPYILSEIPKGPLIGQQNAFYHQMDRKDYIKVVDGLMVEMTQAEKDAVDAALAAAKQPVTDARAEIQENDLCNTALTDLTVIAQKEANLKQNIADMINNAPTTPDKIQAVIQTEQMIVTHLYQLARCVNSYAVVRGAPTS